MSAAPRRPGPPTLSTTLSAFADRVFRTGGRDPGDAALPLPPERLEIYRDLLVGNYRSMLVHAYSATFRLLRHELERQPAANGDASREDVIVRFLATSPSATHSSREIADRFRAFLPGAYPDLIARRPELPDLLALERAELRALYHADDPGRGATVEEVEALRVGSVGDFLGTSVVRAPSASLLRLAYPAAAVHDEIDARRFPSPPEPAHEVVSVARHPRDLTAVHRVVREPGASALAAIGESETLPLERLAERWIAASPPGLADLDEAAAFRSFGDAVLGALLDGFLRLAGTPREDPRG